MLLSLSVAALGCSGKARGGKGIVHGKVTYNSKPVAGTVIFVDPNNQPHPGPIAQDGTYMVEGLPVGHMKVMVKGMPGAGPAANGGGGGQPADMPKMVAPGSKIDTNTPAGVAPPDKYASTDTSGLTFDTNGQKQEFNIELK
jgi:hypothetical protein